MSRQQLVVVVVVVVVADGIHTGAAMEARLQETAVTTKAVLNTATGVACIRGRGSRVHVIVSRCMGL